MQEVQVWSLVRNEIPHSVAKKRRPCRHCGRGWIAALPLPSAFLGPLSHHFHLFPQSYYLNVGGSWTPFVSIVSLSTGLPEFCSMGIAENERGCWRVKGYQDFNNQMYWCGSCLVSNSDKPRARRDIWRQPRTRLWTLYWMIPPSDYCYQVCRGIFKRICPYFHPTVNVYYCYKKKSDRFFPYCGSCKF